MKMPTRRKKIWTGRFEGKVAIVTGGTSGIGLATAIELLREGCRVVVTSLPGDVADGEKVFRRARLQPLILSGDMAEDSFCEEVVATTLKHFKRIDGLVNNAFSFLAKALDADREDFERSFSVGPVGFARMIQLVSEPMRRRKGGSIVNVSSISAVVAQRQRWTYNMAKGAVSQLTRCAALDLAASGIRVNSVSPGWIWTREVEKAAAGDRAAHEPVWGEYHMLSRLGEAHEVAAAILFLLSDDASFITGTDLPVDGGYQSMGPEGLGKTAKIAGSR